MLVHKNLYENVLTHDNSDINMTIVMFCDRKPDPATPEFKAERTTNWRKYSL
jgi:hypothetical protein